MKLSLLSLISAAAMVATAAAAPPKIFEGLLQEGVPMRGDVGQVVPPPEYETFAAKIETAARKDIKWFKEFSDKAPPGEPLPYDEKLGLTPEEHAEYVKAWDRREFKSMEPVILMLRKSSNQNWVITATGPAGVLSTIRFSEKSNTFTSPNGELVPGTDIDTTPNSVYGEWKGKRWEFNAEDTLGKTKEVLAMGKLTKTGHALILYRFTEITTEGRPVADSRIVVRFLPGKAGEANPSKPAGDKPSSTPAKSTNKTKR